MQRRLRCNSWVAAACEEGVPEPGSLCISCSVKDLGKQAAQPVPFLRVTQLLGHNKQCRCRDGPPSPLPAQLMLDSSNSLRFELSFDKILRTDCRVYMESLASFTGTKSNTLLPDQPCLSFSTFSDPCTSYWCQQRGPEPRGHVGTSSLTGTGPCSQPRRESPPPPPVTVGHLHWWRFSCTACSSQYPPGQQAGIGSLVAHCPGGAQ